MIVSSFQKNRDVKKNLTISGDEAFRSSSFWHINFSDIFSLCKFAIRPVLIKYQIMYLVLQCLPDPWLLSMHDFFLIRKNWIVLQTSICHFNFQHDLVMLLYCSGFKTQINQLQRNKHVINLSSKNLS